MHRKGHHRGNGTRRGNGRTLVSMVSTRRLTPPRHRLVAGLALTVGGTAIAVAVLVPFRSHIDVDTAALVLVIPVVLGTAVGGFPVAPVGVVTGFVGV